MNRENKATGKQGVSRRGEQASDASWPPWEVEPWDDVLRVTLAEVTTIGDPAKRAWQAGRVLALVPELAHIRAEAVQTLHAQGKSWTEVGRLVGVSRGRACAIAHEDSKRSKS